VLEEDRYLLGLLGEREGAGEQLVEHGRQAVHVGRGRERPAAHLLRGDVRRCTEHVAVPGYDRVRPADDLCDAEVGDLDDPARGEEHVLGLDVAVQDPAAVRGAEPARAGQRHRGRVRGGEAARGADAAAQRPPGQQLHHEQADAVAFDKIEHGHDMRMIERGQDAGLGGEPAPHGRIGREVRGKLLDGYLPVELPVLAGDHGPPGAPAQYVTDVISG
jgi:hypothetical protein